MRECVCACVSKQRTAGVEKTLGCAGLMFVRRDEAMRQTRKLQREIAAEREKVQGLIG